MGEDVCAVNGRIVPTEDATVSVLDLGFLRGVGAFETLRTYGGGHPHALDEHLARLWESASAFAVAPFLTAGGMRQLIHELYTRCGHAELRLNLLVTPGINTSGVFGADCPTWVVIARDVHAPEQAAYAQGVTAITFEASRHLPTLKTTNYLVGKTGLVQAEQVGAHEAFYVDRDGHVTEGVTSNVLLLSGGDVITPAQDCLPGITKSGLKPLALAMGLAWSERAVTRSELYAADEVWISSAVRELMPIVAVDGRPIGTGSPGPWAARLRGAYHAACIHDARRDAERA